MSRTVLLHTRKAWILCVSSNPMKGIFITITHCLLHVHWRCSKAMKLHRFQCCNNYLEQEGLVTSQVPVFTPPVYCDARDIETTRLSVFRSR